MAGTRRRVKPVIVDETAPTPGAAAPEDAATAGRVAMPRERRHEDQALDEALIESFPCSDPPATWAGP